MSKLLIALILISLFLTPEVTSAVVHARGGAELLNAKAYSVKITASAFSTTALFDETGVSTPMNQGDAFRYFDTDFLLSYGLSANLETSLMFKARNVSATSQGNALTKSGPESAGVAAKYSFPLIGKMNYALGVYYNQTMYTNTTYPTQVSIPVNEIILGDDGHEYGVGLYLTQKNNPWKLDSYLLYVSPPNDLSSEIRYKAEAFYLFSKLALGAGLEGIYSLNRDQTLQKPYLARGPTKMFNSLNRQLMAPYIGLNYSFDKILLAIKGETIVSGRSTDKGNSIAIGVSWSSEGIKTETIKIDSFKEYHIDGSVLKISARGNFIKIDQGLSTDVEKGMKFDIYQTDYFGGNVLVGTGVVFEVGSDWAVIKLVKKYKEIEIKPVFAARGF